MMIILDSIDKCTISQVGAFQVQLNRNPNNTTTTNNNNNDNNTDNDDNNNNNNDNNIICIYIYI